MGGLGVTEKLRGLNISFKWEETPGVGPIHLSGGSRERVGQFPNLTVCLGNTHTHTKVLLVNVEKKSCQGILSSLDKANSET